MSAEFGTALKEWRTTRRMSQLELGLSAGVSSRHISFLETGRSRPSRGMVFRLCDELEVPFSARNTLLTAAGLSPAYKTRDLSDADMRPVRQAVEWTLNRHDPYPGFALNRHWDVVQMNTSAGLLLGVLGIGQGDNMIEALIDNPAVRRALLNHSEVVQHMILRLRAENAHVGTDRKLEAMIDRLCSVADDAPVQTSIRPAFIPTSYRFGDRTLSLFSTISQFGTAEDIALSELRIELIFPADDETKQFLESAIVN